jgi:hypothetical protein
MASLDFNIDEYKSFPYTKIKINSDSIRNFLIGIDIVVPACLIDIVIPEK